MIEPKIQSCPMSFNSPPIDNTTEATDYKCIKNDCAWWVACQGGVDKCAILVIAEGIEKEKK